MILLKVLSAKRPKIAHQNQHPPQSEQKYGQVNNPPPHIGCIWSISAKKNSKNTI
jgi:hypothetical protein